MAIEVELNHIEVFMLAVGVTFAFLAILDFLKYFNCQKYLKLCPESVLASAMFSILYVLFKLVSESAAQWLQLILIFIPYFFLFSGAILEKRNRERIEATNDSA